MSIITLNKNELKDVKALGETFLALLASVGSDGKVPDWLWYELRDNQEAIDYIFGFYHAVVSAE